MSNVRVKTVLLCALTFLPAAGAQEGDACVPAELVAGLLGDISAPRLTVGGLPASFPELVLPPGSRILGSASFSTQQQVVVTTSLDVDSAHREVVAGMGKSGWREPPRHRPERGFVAVSSREHTVLCHEKLGTMHLSGTATSAGGGDLTFRFTPRGKSGLCDASHEHERAVEGEFESLFPRLDLPEGSEVRGSSGWSGGSSTRVGASQGRSTLFVTDEYVVALGERFFAQLERQGWIVDVRWEGTRSVGGALYLDSPDGPRLFGTLSVTAFGARMVEALFRLVDAGDAERSEDR